MPNNDIAPARQDLVQEVRELGSETARFFRNIFPSLLINDEQLSGCLEKHPDDLLGTFHFINIQSLSVEDKEDLGKNLSGKMARLFAAVHPLGTPVLWGVISEHGNTRLVAGVQKPEHVSVLMSVLEGMLTGSVLQECKPEFASMSSFLISHR